MNKLTRVGIDMDSSRIAKLDALVARSGFSSRKDLINEAISFFDFVLKNVEDGGSLPCLTTKDGKEIEIVNGPFTRARDTYSDTIVSNRKSARSI